LLTADLVNARRQGRELRIVALDARARTRAAELAAIYLDLALSHVGASREDLKEACAAVEAAPRERRLADGLWKLVEDRCEFDAESPIDPQELRRAIFLRASSARRDGTFERGAVLGAIAEEHGLTPAALDQALYADLRGAHTLQRVEPIGAERLVDEYELQQAQAVLLRAVRVTVDVECRSPGAYRALFHKLKFLRLLYTLSARGEGGYRIELDGPFSLFESVTKYGLQLALALPVIRECDAFVLEAEVRWGKQRMPLTFRLDKQPPRPKSDQGAKKDEKKSEKRSEKKSAKKDEGTNPVVDDAPAPHLAEEVARLVEDLRATETPWQVLPSTDILSLPGVGLCVPDLALQHRATGECVYLEVMGFWSRDAVWKRVALVEGGLEQRILFAVSTHLRVSEAALGDELPGALYVYKRVMNARAILDRVDALARRSIA